MKTKKLKELSKIEKLKLKIKELRKSLREANALLYRIHEEGFAQDAKKNKKKRIKKVK